MFSFGEMLFLAAVALIVLGPKQLPEVARVIGRMLNEFKRATGDFHRTLNEVGDSTTKPFLDMKKNFEETIQPIANNLNEMNQSVHSTLNQQLDLTQQLHAPAEEPKAVDEINQMSFKFDEPTAPETAPGNKTDKKA